MLCFDGFGNAFSFVALCSKRRCVYVMQVGKFMLIYGRKILFDEINLYVDIHSRYLYNSYCMLIEKYCK